MLDGPILSINTASTKTRSSSAEVPGVYMFLVEAEEGRTRPETQVGRACEEVSRYVITAPVCRATVSVSPATSSQRPL